MKTTNFIIYYDDEFDSFYVTDSVNEKAFETEQQAKEYMNLCAWHGQLI